MSQKKEKSVTSGMQPPPPSVMQQRPSAMMPRAPWSMSHVLHGQSMMNMPPFYHMIHVPSPLAIVNSHPMFMQPPPNVKRHSCETTVSSCVGSGCQALATPAASHTCVQDNPETTRTTASCMANGSCGDVAFLKFQKNAQVHGIKISSTTEKLGRSRSSSSGRLSVASPEFTPHGVVSGSAKAFAVPESHLPGVIVVSSEDDEDDLKEEDCTNCSKDNEKHEQQTTGVPVMFNGGGNHAIFSENGLSAESQEMKGQLSQSASGVQLNSDECGFFVDGCTCSKQREMVSAYTQTEMTTLENVNPQVFDKWTSTEDLTKQYDDQGSSTEPAAAAANDTENDDPKLSCSKKEISEVSADDCAFCSVEVPSLETLYDSTAEEEMDLPTERNFPEVTDKSKTNSLASEPFLLAVESILYNPRHQLTDVRDKTKRYNLTGKSKASSLTSVASLAIDRQEQSDSLVCEPNGVRSELERLKSAEVCRTNSVTCNTSSTIRKKEDRDCVGRQPSDFRDELRRRNIAAVEAVSEMCKTEQVVSDADIAVDSITAVDIHLNTSTELNIKLPEVVQSHGSEENSRRLETLHASVIYEDQAMDGGASSGRQMSKLPSGPEERNDLSNILSRSSHSSVDNCSVVIDNISGQRDGPSSNHSGDSARQHRNSRADSRNVCREEVVSHFAGASVQEAICSSKTASLKGRDSVTHSESGALKKASNSCVENMHVKGSSDSLLNDGCIPNVMDLADEESLSGSENMSVVMSVSGGELKSDCSSVEKYSVSQIGLTEPSTEVMDMIRSHLLICDPTLSNNPQMLEALAVQQLYLMHQEQVVISQMMEAMRQQQQPHLLSPHQLLPLPQHSAHTLITPQQLLLQQHFVSQPQLAQPHLIPPHPFVVFPPTSKPQRTLPPRFQARLASQDNSCAETLPNVHSSAPENSLRAACANNSGFYVDTSVEDSELQLKSWQDCYATPSHAQLKTVTSQDSAIEAMDYKEHNSVSKCVVDVKDSPTVSAVNGLSAVPLPASHGKKASSVSATASPAFPPNGARSESGITSPAASSRSAARAQLPASSASVANSASGKPAEFSDCKRDDLYGHRKSLLGFSGNNTEVMPSVPLSSMTKPSNSSVLASEKIGLTVPETAASTASDYSFSTRGQGIVGGRGGRPKSIIPIGNIRDGASADGYPGSFQSWEQSRDSVNFNKGEYEKDKLLEFKQSLEDPITRGSAADQCATGGDPVKHRKVFVPEKKGFGNRWTDGPFRPTSTRFQESEEDWGEAGSTNWIKDPLHYGPPKCSTSRVRPKNDDSWGSDL